MGDEAVMADPKSTPRQKVAARLTRIEKGILQVGWGPMQPHAAPCTVHADKDLRGLLILVLILKAGWVFNPGFRPKRSGQS